MAKQITAPRGTRDLLPEETPAWDRVEAVARDLSRRYALERIEIPLFERVELFARGLGESDVADSRVLTAEIDGDVGFVFQQDGGRHSL